MVASGTVNHSKKETAKVEMNNVKTLKRQGNVSKNQVIIGNEFHSKKRRWR